MNYWDTFFIPAKKSKKTDVFDKVRTATAAKKKKSKKTYLIGGRLKRYSTHLKKSRRRY